jgi:general bacterial porin, GBP family
MKKSLFALAALGAFAGAAQAQSSVTLYGNLDLTEAYISSSANKSVALTHAANTTSLWGFTGSEDMGGGLKTGFDLKSEINLTTGQTGSTTSGVTPGATTAYTPGGAANLFTRGANVFISSASMGEVKVGRMDDIEWATSGRYSTSNSNSFGSNQGHAQIGNLVSAGLGSCATLSAAPTTYQGLCGVGGLTTQNYSYMGTADAFMTGIQYKSPSFAGFTVTAQTGLGANNALEGYNVGQQQGVGLGYVGMGGALNADLAISKRFDDAGQLGMTLTSLGLKYKATNSITLTGLYTTTSVMGQSYQAPTAATSTAPYNPGVHGNDMWSVGINYQATPAADVSIAYTNVADNSTAGSANSVSMIGLTGRYNFSKRTQVYAGVGQANNSGAFFMSPIYGGASQNATVLQNSYNGGQAAASNGVGANITGAIIGLRHQF